jgi:hypothetical protein
MPPKPLCDFTPPPKYLQIHTLILSHRDFQYPRPKNPPTSLPPIPYIYLSYPPPFASVLQNLPPGQLRRQMQNPNQPDPPPYTDFDPGTLTALSIHSQSPASQPRSSVDPTTRYSQSPQQAPSAVSSDTLPPRLPSYPRHSQGTFYPPPTSFPSRSPASFDGPAKRKVQLIVGIDFVRTRAAVSIS